MIIVRAAMPKDQNGIAKVEASATATLRRTYRPNREALIHGKMISRNMRRLVAESDGKIVGTVQYHVDGDAIRMIGLGVDADCRRCGVARALVNEIADNARRCGIASIVTCTVVQTGNVPIFEALGFRVCSICPDKFSVTDGGRELEEASLRMDVY